MAQPLGAQESIEAAQERVGLIRASLSSTTSRLEKVAEELVAVDENPSPETAEKLRSMLGATMASLRNDADELTVLAARIQRVREALRAVQDKG